MKITFILPIVTIGGGIKVVGIYAKALAEKGHDVVLVSLPHQTVHAALRVLAAQKPC